MMNIPDSDPLYNLQGGSTRKKKKYPANPPIMETTIGNSVHTGTEVDTEADPSGKEVKTEEDPSILMGHAVAMIGTNTLPPGFRGKCPCTQHRRHQTLLKPQMPRVTAAYIAELELMPLSQVIRHLRISRYMTQNDLAYLSGLRKSSISMYENDKRIPGLNAVRFMGSAMKLRKKEMIILQGKVAGHLMRRALDQNDRDKMIEAEQRAIGRMYPILFGFPIKSGMNKISPTQDEFYGEGGHERLKEMSRRVRSGLPPYPQNNCGT